MFRSQRSVVIDRSRTGDCSSTTIPQQQVEIRNKVIDLKAEVAM